MLNCKQGDWAIIVKSEAGNDGKIVRCLRYFDARWVHPISGKLGVLPSWEIDRELTNWNGTSIRAIPDFQLRPIRDQDGEDEILRIAGKPKSSNNELVNLLQKLTY